MASAEVYDIATDTWTPIASLPHPWMNAADGVVDGSYMVLVGGYQSDSSPSSYGLIYNPVTDDWNWLPEFNHQVYGAAGAFDTDNFWVVSGRMYEGEMLNSTYTTRMENCATACTPVSGLDFTWDPLGPWSNVPTTFSATLTAGSPAISFDWDFGDSGAGQGQVTDYTYLSTGTYQVTVTASNCDGASQVETSHDVTVISPPVDLMYYYLPVIRRE